MIDFWADNIKHLNIILIAIRYRNKFIRLSVSYLFRIKIDDKYLLIKGSRFPQYQPVGGVFKRYQSSVSFFQNIHALDDNLIPIDKDSKHDLRIRVKGRYLLDFMKWFEDRKNREVCSWREFYEELIKSNLLPGGLFPYVNYQFIKYYMHPIRYSDFSQSHEILMAEIYEVILDKEQEEFLRDTIQTGLPDCIWVTEEEILRRGAVPGENYTSVISEHSRWVI